MSYIAGDLVRVINPQSLKNMNVVGVVTSLKYPSDKWFEVWIPDIGREMSFLKAQLEKVE